MRFLLGVLIGMLIEYIRSSRSVKDDSQFIQRLNNSILRENVRDKVIKDYV